MFYWFDLQFIIRILQLTVEYFHDITAGNVSIENRRPGRCMKTHLTSLFYADVRHNVLYIYNEDYSRLFL